MMVVATNAMMVSLDQNFHTDPSIQRCDEAGDPARDTSIGARGGQRFPKYRPRQGRSNGVGQGENA